MQQIIFTIASACLFIFIINFFDLHATSVNGEILPSQQFLGDVAINRGSLTNATALDGRHFLVAFGRLNMNMNGLTMFLALTCAAVYLLRHLCEHKFWLEEDKHVPLANQNLSERILNKDVKIFLLKDIKSATRNFSRWFKIEKCELYTAYKAVIGDGSRTLEIKRAKRDKRGESNKARKAFKEHIEFLKYCEPHINLAPSVGYCDEDNETILVYEYTPHFHTLDWYIFRDRTRQFTNKVLSWGQRLRICRDAALGLHHLHKSHMVHKDMNIFNIKLDENLVPKIFGFGCIESRFRDTSTSSQETVDYIDPHYAVTGMLTEASDVYSFGIVMLVVLSGFYADQHKKPWFTECLENGNFQEIMDPNLKRMNEFEGLEIFGELINKCLMLDPKDRPNMAQVVADLDAALCLAL